jgi:glycosyltransferase involved in cell wall biosynthesis
MSLLNIYLKKRGITVPWKIEPKPVQKFIHTVIIPAYAESEYLPLTLASLDTNNLSELKETLVIVVVNNASDSSKQIRNDNKITLQKLDAEKYHFTLGVVDASSQGLELPIKQAGVGLARKIGIDLALPYLLSKDSLIFCTDSDTVVSKNYIKNVKNYISSTNTQAAVVGFQHLESYDPKQEEAIRKYEKYLLNTAENIKNAGSPYGYVAMGSTMVCTAQAYCAVGGMPRKKVTEDFYFLQELAKFCGVHTISGVLVYPSPRPISRVYLGTGYRMKQAQNGFNFDSLYYSELAFQLLSKWINLGSNAYPIELFQLRKKTFSIHPNLTDYLLKEGIEDVWDKLQKNITSESHLSSQFHRWFDGLKTIRFLRHFSKVL